MASPRTSSSPSHPIIVSLVMADFQYIDQFFPDPPILPLDLPAPSPSQANIVHLTDMLASPVVRDQLFALVRAEDFDVDTAPLEDGPTLQARRPQISALVEDTRRSLPGAPPLVFTVLTWLLSHMAHAPLLIALCSYGSEARLPDPETILRLCPQCPGEAVMVMIHGYLLSWTTLWVLYVR